jgi:heme A synthase
LKKMALSLTGILAVQIALGAVTVLSRKAVPVTTAHVATGALLLGMALTFTLCSRRKTRSSESRAARGTLARKEAVA